MYITAKHYIKEAISQIEKRMKLTLREEKMHMRTSDHPEIDVTPLLDTIMHREYQSLFGMLQWVVTLCRVDICFATSTMSRFSAASREGHLTRVLRIWGYLKKYPNNALGIDHTPLHNKDEIHQKTIIEFANQYSYNKSMIILSAQKRK
jgi:hypothetical protein